MYHQLSHEERYRISAEVRAGQSLRAVARLLGRSPSTVSRELRRNATNNDGLYRPDKAQRYCVARRRRCRRGPRYAHGQLAMIERLIRRRWSPRQVCGTLRAAGTPVPSHETLREMRLLLGAGLFGFIEPEPVRQELSQKVNPPKKTR